MSEQIGNLYVRAASEEEVQSGSGSNGSPKKSTSLSSLRSLRDTFKRSESRASKSSLAASTTINENNESGSAKKPGEYSAIDCVCRHAMNGLNKLDRLVRSCFFH